MKHFRPTPEACQLFHDATLALSQIEANGIRVDLDYIEDKIEETTQQIKRFEQVLKQDHAYTVWKRRFGSKTNLSSRPQLAEIMFNQLGFKRNEAAKTKDRNREKADEAAFANVDTPFIETYFRMQKLLKARDTYLVGIKRETINGFCHPSFSLHLVVSYRSSSDNPNFQNMPIRNPEIGKLIRSAFIPRDGYQLAEIDFKGIEVHVACCYTHDPRLIEEFTTEGKDPHGDTACQLFMMKKSQVAKLTTRHVAKNQFVFPQFYGSVYFQCAPAMWESIRQPHFKVEGTETSVRDHLKSKGITKLGNCEPGALLKDGTFVKHVQQVEDNFWNKRFKVYTVWMRRWWNQYLHDGGFKMLTGIACWGVFKRNEVLNYPVQGSAFHWLLWSLVQIQKWLRKNKMKTKIVGQIHDSIVVDIYLPERDKFLARCQEIIAQELPRHWKWINVPVETEVEISPPGESWHAKKRSR